MTCEDIDECALPTGGHICSYRCHNTAGSFHCSCPVDGYTLAANGRNCQDVDECIIGTHTCTENQTCFNVQGSFRCLSFECPENYRKSGETRCERLLCYGSSDVGACLAAPLRITHYYLTFPTTVPASTHVFRMGPAQPAPGDDIQVAIEPAGNEGGYFSMERAAAAAGGSSAGGVMSVARPIGRPQDFELRVLLTLRRHGVQSTYMAVVHVYVTEDAPPPPRERYNALEEQ